MLNVMLVGAAGHMGQTVAECARSMPDVTISAGIDVQPQKEAEFPMFATFWEADRPADVVVDFSRPGSLDDILAYCKQQNIGAVLATTGYDDLQLKQIDEASRLIPIFKAANFSIGIALLCQLVRQAAQVLLDRSDIEIVERHHNRKVDAPSGTALSILEELNTVRPGAKETFGRHGNNAARTPNEIGIHAVRGGGLVGDHEVMFLSEKEELDITHRAYSREVFAQGALTAAGFITSKSSGIYGMRDLLHALGLHDSQNYH